VGYAVGPVVAPAAGFGAPQGRHRIYFVAESERRGLEAWGSSPPGRKGREAFVEQRGEPIVLADASNPNGRPGERGAEAGTREDGERRRGSASGGAYGVVGKPDSPGPQPGRETGQAGTGRTRRVWRRKRSTSRGSFGTG
jgi:site-specific DNA-cytosine methylase